MQLKTEIRLRTWHVKKHHIAVFRLQTTNLTGMDMISAINCISAPVEVGEMSVEVGEMPVEIGEMPVEVGDVFWNLVRWWPLWPILFVFFWRGDAEGLGSTCSRVFFSRWNRSFPIEICWKQASGESKDKQNSQKVMKMNIRAMRDSLCKQRWTYSWPDSDVFCQKNHHQTKQTHENREGFLMKFPQGWKFRIPKRSSRVSLEHQNAYHLDI